MTDIHQKLLAYPIWLSLPHDIRNKLSILFDIPKTGRTVVEYRAEGAIVTSDGYTPSDLFAISMPKMQALLDDPSEDFYALFEEIVDNLDSIMGGTFSRSTVSAPINRTPPRDGIQVSDAVPLLKEVVDRIEQGPFPTWQEYVRSFRGQGLNTSDLSGMYKKMKEGHENAAKAQE